MRQLSFKGFLYQYVQALSQSTTNDIRLLAAEVPNNYRLVEPLVLYAASVNKREHLKRNAKDSYLKEKASLIPDNMSWNGIISMLECEDNKIPREFHKIYKSYLSIRDKQKSTNHTKSLVLKRTRELQKEKGITTYRLYTDLKLNHGNVHTYIKNGDVSKVSLEVAESILEYLKTA